MPVSEDLPGRAADCEANRETNRETNREPDCGNGASIASFNSLYQAFVGVPIETRESRRTISDSPALLKIAIAGTSALVAGLIVVRALTQDAAAPPTYRYRQPASPEQNSSTAIPAVMPPLAQSDLELREVPLRSIQPTRRFSVAGGGSQPPQIAPPESLVLTSLRSTTAESVVAAPRDTVLNAPANPAPSIASAPNQSSQSAESLLPESVATAPPSTAQSTAQAESAPSSTQSIAPSSVSVTASIAPPSVMLDRAALPVSPIPAAEGNAAVTSETALPQSSPTSSIEPVSGTAGQRLQDLIAAKQGTSERFLPLSDRAMLEADQTDRVGAFRVVRLPRLVYQNIWLNLQAESKASLQMPTHGFVDRQQQMIVLPTP